MGIFQVRQNIIESAVADKANSYLEHIVYLEVFRAIFGP